MYVQGQFVQGMRYTTPGLSCWGTWYLGCTKSCCKVLIGRKVVLMPREDRTRQDRIHFMQLLGTQYLRSTDTYKHIKSINDLQYIDYETV